MRSADIYQIALITLGVVATAFLGMFVYHEMYPEYRIYQGDYIALEKFRSSYTGEPPPAFKEEVKQIVLERDDKGPAVVDRCISCHVALQISDFSPTRLARDINGNIKTDEKGIPSQEPNESYIWGRLDKKIAELRDPKVNEQLDAQGESWKVKDRLSEADQYASLKTAKVGSSVYDVTKVLSMHPLIGKETRPFEFHPVEEYGCTSCHSGNGKALTTEKAHGPVFDGQYDTEHEGAKPAFTEADPDNDPSFSRVFNAKPGDSLVFQTTPLFVGALLEAKCLQCHQRTDDALKSAAASAKDVTKARAKMAYAAADSFAKEKESLAALLQLEKSISAKGVVETWQHVQNQSNNYTLSPKEREYLSSQAGYLQGLMAKDPKNSQKKVAERLKNDLLQILGSEQYVDEMLADVNEAKSEDMTEIVNQFIEKHRADSGVAGSVFAKADKADLERELLLHIQQSENSQDESVADQNVIGAMQTDVDLMTEHYRRGQELYITQGCYACHKIAGFARGGVGPELTREGNKYPWFIKESLVWPQADLKTSTMPNYKMDHEELEDLVTYLLGQTGPTPSISSTGYKKFLQEWEAGRKLAWEKPISPAQVHDLRYAMTVFATEGCAACHRLKGYQSSVGFAIEKENKPDSAALYAEQQWFQGIIPEQITGSQLVAALKKHADEIDTRINDQVRDRDLLEEIEAQHPGLIESYYTPFKYAARAMNRRYAQLAEQEQDPEKKARILSELTAWKARVHKVLMLFVQEYGLGRLIGPRPNWSGVYRTDEWLMEHFRKPTAHIPRSIMPVFPFDDTKFYALTYMLDNLGVRNRDAVREIWENRGFNPEIAYQIYCSQCHGDFLEGNGPVAEWIYPIPKNLRNADFLRNLTKEQVKNSIQHGISGTPMPPWGEAAAGKPDLHGIPVLNEEEIDRLVDWLFSSIPGSTVIKGSEDVPKWKYSPEDAQEELKQESGSLDASIFDRVPNPQKSPDKYLYKIKKKYYTPANLAQGKEFFDLNCAVCHGKEGDGAGSRTEAMVNAKPRMFINIDWSESRDDLRLLRSIKYGVPGTAMTPWGDMTSSLQRLQLVMYIRSLSENAVLREQLFQQLYRSFDTSLSLVEKVRSQDFSDLAKAQKEYQELQEQRRSLSRKVESNKASAEEAVKSYQEELAAREKLRPLEARDQLLSQLKDAIRQEEFLYQKVGLQLLGTDQMADDEFPVLLEWIALNQDRYSDKDGSFLIHLSEENNQALAAKAQKIIEAIDQKIEILRKKVVLLQGKIQSAEIKEELSTLAVEILALQKLQNEMISAIQEAARLREKQQTFYQAWSKEPKEVLK
jgi:mono/diheme cytochrome c family protein